MSETPPNPVIHIDEAQSFPMAPENGSDRFGALLSPLGDQIGSHQLGAMLTRVKPGMRAFPFHNHLGNDELFIIISGTGSYRFGEKEFPVRSGSICAAPRGGPETAHQLINTGNEELVYLAISTKQDPDVIEYPDSNKFAALAISPGADFMNAHLKFAGRVKDSLDYWEGES